MYKPRIEVVFGNERIISPSGLNIVGAMLGKSDFKKRCDRRKVDPKRSQPQIKDGDILLTYIGLLTLGKTAYDSVHEFDDDPDYYQTALGIAREIPSAESIRQRMDDIGDDLRPNLLDANVDMFVAHSIFPGMLPGGEVPVDMDVTPFDNSKTMKEGVSWTYKGFDGYAPMVAYIGTEGFMANIELREGKQHCQAHRPEFLKETLAVSHRMTDKPLLIRMDSGNDAAENLGILIEDGSWFIVKRNPRKESKEGWLNELRGCCQDIRHPRPGKDVYVGTTWKDVSYKTSSGETKTTGMRIVYEIIERTIDKHGQILMIPDVERLPSGKFATNALVLELAMIAYNLLRMIGQESLKHKQPTKRKVRHRRLRTVIENLMLCASHFTKHAQRLIMALGCSNTWRHAFWGVWQRFALS